ncbi:lipase member H-like [Danaus plexippus]|uniref:lipase member H-like n=1 Tax=Danaus plexippus TaxID=13037 RepID=UPI002AB1B8FE|nr:lipase member H-like [Danaus plexippus]
MKSIFIFVICLSVSILAGRDTGYPAGLMAECPGMTKNTTLSEETKNSLRVVVLCPDKGWLASREESCPLDYNGVACVSKHIDLKKKTLVYISGYLDASFSPIVRALTIPYLERGRNVIIMEIYPILHRSYPIAARLTKPLGYLLGDFLSHLTHKGLSHSKLELLGGSLGAHIAYYAATRYYELTHFKPNRLTGLDPAGPCFRSLPPRDRFHSAGALKVDAIHTNIDGFGIPDTIGHVDFYVNGGEFQPSMVSDYLLPCFQLCSHVRSAIYWLIASYERHQFVGVKCNSVAEARHGKCYYRGVDTNVLGPKTNFNRPGIYYLPTTENKPFYMGKEGLKKRKYDVNHYLLQVSPEKDMII